MQSVKKSQYRQRIFQMVDGSIIIVYENDPIPVDDIDDKLVPGTILADHDVIETATVTDHVEPVPAA